MNISVISAGLYAVNRPVQPWRYLAQCAGALALGGHNVSLISDGAERYGAESTFAGLPVRRVASLRARPFAEVAGLETALQEQRPDLVLWHVGLTTLKRLCIPRHLHVPVVGVFTSPLYTLAELTRIGYIRLMREHRLSLVHLMGLLTRKKAIRAAFAPGRLAGLVVEGTTTCDALVQRGAPPEHLQIIRPFIDPAWLLGPPAPDKTALRRQYGFAPDDFIVGFFGSPAPLRGLPTLLQAARIAGQEIPRLRVFALSRVLNRMNQRNDEQVMRLVTRLELDCQVRVVPGMLTREQLAENLSACDAIALPFELVPSDMPLSPLEAQALGLPVITTGVACLPELVPDGTGIRVAHCNATAMAEVLTSLARDDEKRSHLARSGREHALNWITQSENQLLWNRMADAYR